MNLQSFDLNLLKVLDALLREASTTRAGERIGLSQPAVSAALGRLRAAFDDPLLVRDGQSLRPTEFALSLVTPLQHLLEDAGQLLKRPAFDPVDGDRRVSPFGRGLLHRDAAAGPDRTAGAGRSRGNAALHRRDQRKNDR